MTKSTHNASTFQPYDASEAMGDTLPTTPKPPKTPKCGAFGQILQTAVTIAITQLLSMTPLAPVAPILGNAAGQLFGMATGIQQGGFNWKSLGMTALTIALPNPGGFIGGALNNAAAQGIGVAIGLQDKFSWSGVAAAGVGSALSAATQMGYINFGKGALGDILATSADVLAQAATRSIIDGNSFGDNLIASLPSALGNLAGRWAAQGIGTAFDGKSGGSGSATLKVEKTTGDKVANAMSSNGCFIAGTAIHTPNGIVAIEAIKVGDWVYSRDEAGDEATVTQRKVSELFRFADRRLHHITIASSAEQNATLSVTSEHPFWVEGKGWVVAKHLRAGDKVPLINGEHHTVTGNISSDDTADVYNFTVDTDHTYFVGEAGIWVHNKARANAVGDDGAGLTEENSYIDENGMRRRYGNVPWKIGFQSYEDDQFEGTIKNRIQDIMKKEGVSDDKARSIFAKQITSSFLDENGKLSDNNAIEQYALSSRLSNLDSILSPDSVRLGYLLDPGEAVGRRVAGNLMASVKDTGVALMYDIGYDPAGTIVKGVKGVAETAKSVWEFQQKAERASDWRSSPAEREQAQAEIAETVKPLADEAYFTLMLSKDASNGSGFAKAMIAVKGALAIGSALASFGAGKIISKFIPRTVPKAKTEEPNVAPASTPEDPGITVLGLRMPKAKYFGAEYQADIGRPSSREVEKTIGGPRPKGLHGHHVVEVNGRKGEYRAWVRESQDILKNGYEIDPLLGEEALVWAPNRGHTIGEQRALALELRDAQSAGHGRDVIIDILNDYKERARRR